MDMPEGQKPPNKIFLMLQSNGYLVLDRDRLWDGCDTPELDPTIEMSPISIQDLVEAVRDRNLEFMDEAQTDNLKSLHKQLISSANIIDDTVRKIKASSV